MERIFEKSAGIDVHKKIIVCTMLTNTNGKLSKKTKEFTAFKFDLLNLAKWLAEEDVDIAVMESTSVFWYSVYEALEDYDVNAIVVNAFHVKNVPGRKTDVNDSEWLAELGMCGLLRKSFIPTRDIRDLRVLTRYRSKLVSMLAAEKCRLGKYLDAAGIRLGCVISDIDGVAARRLIDALLNGELLVSTIASILPKRSKLKASHEELANSLEGRLSDRHRFVLKEIRDHLDYIQNMMTRIDEQVVEGLVPYQVQYELLQTIPGLNHQSAAIILIETGADMSQFKRVESFCAWAGVAPGNNESAGKKKNTRTRKSNKYLKTVLCEVAHAASRTSSSQFHGYHQMLQVRRGYKRAIMAVAHKILRIVYTMLVNNQPYKDPGIDYEKMVVDRNASRWKRKLLEYGHLKTEKK